MARMTDQRRSIGEDLMPATVSGLGNNSADGPHFGDPGFSKPAPKLARNFLDGHRPGGGTSALTDDLPTPSPNPDLPVFNAGNFTAGHAIDNPYFPIIPGTIYTYGTLPDEDEPDADQERNDVFASFETKQILGVTTFVVRDTAYENGILVEDTLDWYAQDDAGNVWYFGELSYSYRYDDDGNYTGTGTGGTWTAGIDNALPGYIMPSPSLLAELIGEDGYFQEFAPGVAEDQANVLGLNASFELDSGLIKGALVTLETSQLDLQPDGSLPVEKKYYEPGIGLVLVEEFDDKGEVELSTELLGVRVVGGDLLPDPLLFRDRGDLDLKEFIDNGAGGIPQLDQPELEDFSEYSSGVHVTYLGAKTDNNNALGAYTYNLSTGVIDDVRILFSDADAVAAGTDFVIDLDEGEGFGLFLVPDGGDLGLELGAFGDGDLSMVNFTTLGLANINDGLAPLLWDNDLGVPLPIPGFHALDIDTTDNFNLLNLDGGIHAVELDVPDSILGIGEEDVSVLGFEDMFATDPEYEADYDDLVITISQESLAPATLAQLVEDLGLV